MGRTTSIQTTLDLKRVAFDGDMRLRNELAAVERRLDETPADVLAADPLLGSLDNPVPPHRISGRAELLKNAVRLTPGLAPAVWRAIDRCTEYLGIEARIEVYVLPDPEGNAFVIPPERGRVVMGITSSCIEKLDQLELVSVVGHELGHIIFDHHRFSPLLARLHDARLAPADAMRLYAWLRYSELSADRVGLLCCDSFDACLSADFKLASGLCDGRHIGDLREVAKQYTALTKEKLEESEYDWLATHPYSPLRIRAMDLFWESTTYAALRGKTGGRVSERALEQEIETMMALMNPSCLDEKAPNRDEVREFLTLGGLTVAMADKRLDDLEMKHLAKLVGDRGLVPSIEPELKASKKARAARLETLAHRLREHTSLLRRRKVVEDLCAIALADHEVADAEQTVLLALATMLDVDTLDVMSALGRAENPLD